MKQLVAAIAATFFAAGVSAGENFDFHHGLSDGNPDLSQKVQESDTMTGIQAGVGDSFDIYRGLADGNPDLSQRSSGSVSASGEDPDIYQELSGNPDLHF
ncbi:MAG: hypothetical protein U9Q81_02025 [Pseudomonadota bacterium]|nr:hypothetical protein [Pseudomonadota bacterium]